MGLRDITGVFSRFFVVGFYLPSFFTVVALFFVLDKPLVDATDKVGEREVLIIGGVALLVALFLVGFRSTIWFKFSGYWWQQKHQIGRPGPEEGALEKGALKRGRLGAHVLAWFRETRFRIATREYRDYVKTGWGLDTWVAWPFIEAEFSERERELHVDALANVHFFQNACLGVVVIAGGLLARAIDDPARFGTWWSLAGAGGSLALAYWFYRGAVSAVRSWGEYKIVSALKHRGDVYAHLGLRRPLTFTEEHQIAREANEWLENASHSPDSRWRG